MKWLNRPEDAPKAIIAIVVAAVMFVGGFAYGAWRGSSTVQTVPIEITAEPPKNGALWICQPIKSFAVAEAEAYYLHRDGYQIVLARDVEQAFKDQSAGRVDLLIQTNRYCFSHPGARGEAVKEYWIKRLKGRRP